MAKETQKNKTPQPTAAETKRRAGGGRKTIYNEVLVKITIRIPQYQIDFINSVSGEKGQSAALREIIDHSIKTNRINEIWNLRGDTEHVERIKTILETKSSSQWEKDMKKILAIFRQPSGKRQTDMPGMEIEVGQEQNGESDP